MTAHPASLWRHPNFLKLWASDTISLFGVYTTQIALPLAAIGLHATAFQLGILAALQTLPSLSLGLFAGALVDRLRRRPVLLAANLARAELLGSIPLAASLGALHLAQLYVVAFLSGLGAIFFVLAYQSYLPTIVPHRQLIEGNSKLRMSEAAAQIVGPGVGGILVQALTAPLALLGSALSSLASALTVLAIRTPEPPPTPLASRPRIHREILEGLHFVRHHPVLRTIAIATTIAALGINMIAAIAVLYATRELGVSAGRLGLIFAAGGATAFLGALLTDRVVRRCGSWLTLVGTLAASGAAALLLLLATGPLAVTIGFLVAWRTLDSLAAAMYNVVMFTLVQAAPPPALLGRVNATMRVCAGGAIALGALLGGALGQTLGLRPTIAIAAAITFLAPLWLALSSTHSLRERLAASALLDESSHVQ